MVDKFPVDTTKVFDGDFNKWAQEGYDTSVSTVYPGFTAGVEPSAAYKKLAESACRSRIMYGGRRLANLMVQIFGDNNVFLQ
jgi:hypothetical protein